MTAFKISYVNTSTGEHGRLPDLGITNIGGAAGPTFFVGGKPLLFADGTATDGSNQSLLANTLQGVYNMSTPATIDFTAHKDLQFNALNGNYFKFDANTGTVTITGDLIANIAVAPGEVKSYEHIQDTTSDTWEVVHMKNSSKPTVTIYDESGALVLPDDITVVNLQTLRVKFNTPIAGRAICLLF